LSRSNILIIPSYTEINKCAGNTTNKTETGIGSPGNANSPRSPGSPLSPRSPRTPRNLLNRMAEDDANNYSVQDVMNSNSQLKGGHRKAHSSESDIEVNTFDNQISERINSTMFLNNKQNHGKALNYFQAISKSFSNDGLLVVRSNDSIKVDKNNEERVDYIYYNRDQDKRRTRKGSVIDDFLEFSTVNPNRKKKIITDSLSTSAYKTARSTIKDYYDTSEEEEPIYNIQSFNNNNNYNYNYGSNYSISRITNNNANAANYYKQRDRLISSTSINMIKNELYYSDYLQNNQKSLSINNLKYNINNPSVQDSVYYDTSQISGVPNVVDYPSNSIYYSTAAILEEEKENEAKRDDNEKDEEEKEEEEGNNNAANSNKKYGNSSSTNANINNNNNNNRYRSKPVNKELPTDTNINTSNPEFAYYLTMANVMNDAIRRNQVDEITGIPQFTTGYDVGNTYISRMHLASSIDIFSRLEALNRSNSLHRDAFSSTRKSKANGPVCSNK